MRVGLIGAGNMARAMARGWRDPVLCSDGGSGRAAQLAAELGGRAASNIEVARDADLVVLCHKPYQLQQVATELRDEVRAVASVLGATSLETLRRAYPGVPVFRLEPNTPVEVRRGVLCYARDPDVVIDETVEREVLTLFERLGRVIAMPERLIGPATSVSAVGPAYMALVAEAQVEAAIRHGVGPDLAGVLAAETMAGTAELLLARGYDTLAVRREVTSPAGSTSRGLDALERGGLRAAFADAMDRILDPPPVR
jgi:pyrroline-5-carboxylate reductase